MGQVSQALGLGSSFTWGTKTYRISPWNYGIQGKFEQYLKAKALRELRVMKIYMTSEEYDRLALNLHGKLTSGEYDFGGKMVAEAFNTPAGMKQLSLLCLQDAQPDDMELEAMVEEIMRVDPEMLMTAMTDANADPNSMSAPVTDPGTLSPSTKSVPS